MNKFFHNTNGTKFSTKKIIVTLLVGALGWGAGLWITGIDTILSIPIGVAMALLPGIAIHYLMN